MTANSSGAVFFLGTRAHYQVLQPPESRYDIENGNASTETIYENPSVHVWKESSDLDSSGDYGRRNWNYCDNDVTEETNHIQLNLSTGMKRRIKRHSSEAELCERDAEMKPALLNYLDSDPPKSKPSRRVSLLTFLASLARRKRRFETDQIQYLQHLESALNSCTYRESCRCLECQSRYFDCDDSDYNSDESECDYTQYTPPAPAQPLPPQQGQSDDENDDDEVFIDKVPEDNTSTDLLLGGREKPTHMSVSSDEVTDGLEEDALEIEVAAGTPVLLNYLLTHPITCNIM